MKLKQISQKDQINLKEVYFDSINSINENIYSKEHKFAWASQAWENHGFKQSITKGKGWKLIENNKTIAFATRFPSDKLSLFYVRGCYQRRGYGKTILNMIEKDALNDGLLKLETDASLISYCLLLKENWEIIRKENIYIKNILFERYKMFKNLYPI